MGKPTLTAVSQKVPRSRSRGQRAAQNRAANRQERLSHLPHELSGGQQQRVAIARALIAKPDVIFADEPTGNLDSRSGGEVMELLKQVGRELGKALVVITHDSRIAGMAARRLTIVDGVLTEVTAG